MKSNFRGHNNFNEPVLKLGGAAWTGVFFHKRYERKCFGKYCPSWLWNRLLRLQRMLVSVQRKCLALANRRFAPRNPVAFQRSLEAAGFQVARDENYYSLLPSVARLKANVARWNRPSALHGIEFDLGAL